VRLRLLTLLAVALSAGVAWRFNTDLAAAHARAARGGVTVDTRCGPIEYEEAGAGVPLLMVHGAGGGHDQGIDFARSLTREGIRVIAMSRFGYMRTPLPADASPEAQADAHLCLLDALAVPRAAVLGLSAGSLSAQQLAIRHPTRVSALVLVVPLGFPSTARTAAPSAFTERVLLWLTGSDFVYWSAIHVARNAVIARVLGTPPELVAAAHPSDQARVNAMLENILPISARAAGLRNETKVASHLQPYDLAAIRAPTLLISTRDDGYGTYASAEYAAARIAGATFLGFEQGGHMLIGHDDEARRAIVDHVIARERG
jgi:2-hydroxy-6-oxonona-2,4-dienedioate hydrolase